MPTTNFLLIILLYFPCVMLHELGHAVAARCVGIHVIACGMGYAKPVFSIRLFGIHFYIARQKIAGGLTLFVFNPLEHRTSKVVLVTAGGIIVNFLLAVISLLLWLQSSSIIFAAIFYINVYMFFISAIPFSFSFGGGSLPNDGQVISNYIRGKTPDIPIKMEIASTEAIQKLCYDIDSWEGVIHSNCCLAILYIGLQDWEKAEEMLAEKYFSDSRRNNFGATEQKQIECFIQFLKDPQDKETWNQLNTVCENNKFMQLLFLTLQVDKNVYNQETTEHIRELCTQFNKTNQGIVNILEGVLLKIDPPENFMDKYNEVFPNIQNSVPSLAIDISICAIDLLIKQENINEARVLFARVNKLFPKLHKNFISEEQVHSVTKELSNQLLKVIGQTENDIPLFVEKSDFVLQAKPSKNYTSILGIASLFIMVFLLPIFLYNPEYLKKILFFTIYLPILGILLSLPIFKIQKNYIKSILFNFFVLCCAITVFVAVVHFKKYDKLIGYLEKEKTTKDIYTNHRSKNYNQGHVHYRSQNYKNAIISYTKVLQDHPKDAKAFYYRALCYYELRKYEKAIFDCSAVTVINSTYSEAHYLKALCYTKLRNYQKAISHHSEAITINPNFVEAYYGRSMCYKKIGKTKEAEEDLQKAKNINPKFFGQNE